MRGYGRQESGFKSSGKSFTHIHLDYVRVEILSCIKKTNLLGHDVLEKMKDIYYGKKVLYSDGTYVIAHFEILGEIFFPGN